MTDALARDLHYPPRSELYRLQPVGVGTADGEGLTSYLVRLAERHGISARTLMSALLPEVRPAFRTLDGPTPWAYEFAKVLESATARDDLRFLTLGFWASAAAYNGTNPALKAQQAYCPLCLEEMRESGGTIYSPLLWSLVWVRACPKHGIALHRWCPHCSIEFNNKEYWRRIGHCNRCGAWLGSSDPRGLLRPMLSERERWTVEQMSSIVEEAPRIRWRPMARPSGWTRLKDEHLTEYGARHRFEKRLAELSGLYWRGALTTWLDGSARPSLQRLLDLGFGINVPLLGLLAPEHEPGVFGYLRSIAMTV